MALMSWMRFFVSIFRHSLVRRSTAFLEAALALPHSRRLVATPVFEIDAMRLLVRLACEASCRIRRAPCFDRAGRAAGRVAELTWRGAAGFRRAARFLGAPAARASAGVVDSAMVTSSRNVLGHPCRRLRAIVARVTPGSTASAPISLPRRRSGAGCPRE